MEKSPQGLKLQEELQTTQEKLGLGRWENQKEHTVGYLVPNRQAWKHTSNIVWTELLIFLDV